MNIFHSQKALEINEGVQQFSQTPGALLLDVRDPREYSSGHIPGSINLPLLSIDEALSSATSLQDIPSLNTPLYVYCMSGIRSRLATVMLAQIGYTCVRNIGGFNAWNGTIE